MNKALNIYFIINPISGKGNYNLTAQVIQEILSKEFYDIHVSYSLYPKHAIELTHEALKNNPDVIVACGGDGTINEVASCLVGTKIPLGIIPIGSGNGLASNLKIPKSIQRALLVIKKFEVRSIDVGTINHQYFFSNTGFGIDALIIKKYQENGSRTLIAYLIATLKSIVEYNYNLFDVTINTTQKQVKPFLFFISNSNEMGYGISLTPQAVLDDGKLNLVIVPKINWFQKIYFGLAIVFNKLHKVSFVSRLVIKEVVCNHSLSQLIVQVDGEFFVTEAQTITIAVIPGALNVIA